MLTYRTFINIAGDREVILDRIDEQVHSWIRSKGWDPERLSDGRTVEIANGVEGSLLRLETRDGSRTTRLLTTEASGWSVRLTAHVPGAAERDPWLWVDVHGPTINNPPGVPRLVTNIVGVVDARDGGHPLPPNIVRAGVDDVGDVIARVLDPQRRTVAFVAGSADGIPIEQWASHVDRMTRFRSGLASVSVLDAAATREFERALGVELAVQPWTMRTFMPQVHPEDPADPLRHRYLTMQRIIDEPPRRIATMLGGRAASVLRDLPLPREATRVSQALSKHLDEVIVDRITEVGPDVASSVLSNAALAVSASTPGIREEADHPAKPTEVEELIAAAARQFLGVHDVDTRAIHSLIDLAAVGRQATEQQVRVRARMDQLQARSDDLELQLEVARSELQEERLEHNVTELERARADDLIRRLRQRLSSQGQDAWSDRPATDDELVPRDFSELIERIGTLGVIVFTGDADVTVGLDSHESAGTWAVKTWEALSALADYATATADGQCASDVEGYLRNLPPGRRGFSVNRHSRDETDDVRSNPRFRRPRELPVPTEVSQTGAIFMGAHFKIAQSGMTSPRLHYYDDTARSGRVYVGHIGPHLPTSRTN